MFIPRSNWILPQHYNPSPPSKVVSIPVHFVEKQTDDVTMPPETTDRETAVVKVQKAARGFLVRKNVRVVRAVEAEVERVGRMVEENRELIGREEKERLRLGEMLMRALFKLDSVRGVRDYRKKVVKRAVLLQEALDSIPNSNCGCDSIGIDAEEEKSKNGVAPLSGGFSSGESCVLDEEDQAVVDGSKDESKRMIAMVEELLEKNEAQSRMILGLSRKVEDLERKVEKMARKKKRHDVALKK